jgi:hypothetical protein
MWSSSVYGLVHLAHAPTPIGEALTPCRMWFLGVSNSDAIPADGSAQFLNPFERFLLSLGRLKSWLNG